ncbi:4Fe-4S dicluster domain-containing protein [Candidatus Hecatella orcuttiae]|jgi:Fe-S-cluster-containing dehydrogenase component|uniref:4Fe-4S dicluster domain-containing protein n=1 Tax=Candidatus Hecatella orcuttiae TaxID=1935119 RepID=UPI0028681842|nr:4Fe-4S dicluster domain-containing protein [Candidatus Hecatella orcuttiae]
MVYRRLSVVDVDLCVGCQCCMFACNRRFAEAGLSRSAIHVRSAGGFERGFVVTVCRACPDPPCMKVCPTNALELRKHGGVILKPEKCIGCQNCVEACTIGAIFWNKVEAKPVICVYCGYCADFCAFGVLKAEPLEGEKK